MAEERRRQSNTAHSGPGTYGCNVAPCHPSQFLKIVEQAGMGGLDAPFSTPKVRANWYSFRTSPILHASAKKLAALAALGLSRFIASQFVRDQPVRCADLGNGRRPPVRCRRSGRWPQELAIAKRIFSPMS